VTPEEQAAYDAQQDKLLRDLASQIAGMTKLPFDPGTVRKGIIAAVDDAAAPPTVSINISGDTSTLISQIRTLNNYTPLPGQTVLVFKQGTDIFLLGAIAAGSPFAKTDTSDNGWIQADLSNGSHGGNSNGNIYYRRIMDHGSWKMQWRGAWNVSGTSMIASAKALSADYRPASKVSVIAARTATHSNAVGWDFNTDGTVTLVGPTVAPSSVADGDFSVGSHAHAYDDNYGLSAEFFLSDSTYTAGGFSVGTHNHSISVSSPTWASLNGIEYFL
jgi:hypothetical protein